jgi:hypothetical protein
MQPRRVGKTWSNEDIALAAQAAPSSKDASKTAPGPGSPALPKAKDAARRGAATRQDSNIGGGGKFQLFCFDTSQPCHQWLTSSALAATRWWSTSLDALGLIE